MDNLFRIAMAFAGVGLSAAPGYVGAAACRPCHTLQFASQATSQHARALRPMSSTQVPEAFIGVPLQERSGVVFEYTRKPDGLGVSISKGDQRVEAVLGWAFGSGAQAVTPVGRYRGAFVEHRLSYYREPDRPARTIGHSGTPSPSAEAALGVRQDAATVTRCFECHATGVQPGPDLSAMTPGVTCERCHGPGADHVRAPATAKLRRTAAVELCAECHRMPEGTGRQPEAQDPASVRFQLVGLSASACFQRSGVLTCVSCHNPHEDARRAESSYVAVCTGCHSTPSKAGAACGRNANQNCLPCHMPKNTPMRYLTFTDHRIRVNGR